MELRDSDILESSSGSLGICTVVSSDTGDICGERNGLQILDEFRKLYETRIAAIDTNNPEGSSVRIRIMEEWIRDLDAQNVMLVKTVQELEEAAYHRVKVLEDKLRQTSSLISSNMQGIEQPRHHRLQELETRLDILEREEDFLKTKIRNLKDDIAKLFQILKRAYYEKTWSMEGIAFREVREEDIPIPFGDREAQEEPRSRENHKVTGHERLKLFCENEKGLPNDHNETTVDNGIELMALVDKLKTQKAEMDGLKTYITAVEKEALESREALALEVAQKHDDILILKKQLALLEEQSRQMDSHMHFKDDIIKEMRNELKHNKSSPLSVPSQKSSGVTWGEVSTHELSDEDENHDDSAIKRLKTLKTRMNSEQYELAHLKTTLLEMVEAIQLNEKRSDSCKYNASKLTDAIDLVSRICLDKPSEIFHIELILQEVRENLKPVVEPPVTRRPATSRDDYRAMEEFRMCTVEAQASVEDLQEEIASIISSFTQRLDSFRNLQAFRLTFLEIIDHISPRIKSFQGQIEEKFGSKDTIASSGCKLKDLKEAINECLRSQQNQFPSDPCPEGNLWKSLTSQFVEEMEYLICNLGLFLSKEESTCNVLVECRDHVIRIDSTLKNLQKTCEDLIKGQVLESKDDEQRMQRVDKFYAQLDDAHSRMRDNLEDLVERAQRYEALEETSDSTADAPGLEVQRLRDVVECKDKLIQDKDEVIRIQKDSIFMSQEEIKDLQSRLQKKIDAHVDIVNEHLREKEHLFKETKLQTETIQHLQLALVEAKKRERQSVSQKSPEVWTAITPTVFNNGDVHDV